MIERHIMRSINQHAESGGPIRMHPSRLSVDPSSTSQSPYSTVNSSPSPRLPTSTASSPATQISYASILTEAPTISRSIASTASSFSVSRILNDITRPSPPPTTPMYQLPVRPTPVLPIMPSVSQLSPVHFPILPQNSVASLLNMPLPEYLTQELLNNNALTVYLLARMHMMNLSHQI